MSASLGVEVKREGNGTRIMHQRISEIGPQFDQLPHDVQFTARNYAPVDTTELIDSIHVVKKGDDEYDIVVGAEHGIYVEYGTRYTAAQPFFARAARQEFRAFREAVLGG